MAVQTPLRARRSMQRWGEIFSTEIRALTHLANSNSDLYREGSEFLALGFIDGRENDEKLFEYIEISR